MKPRGTIARDIMSTDVVTVVPSMSLRTAARVLRERCITGAAVVTETGRLLGVLSESDMLASRNLDDTTVGEAFRPYVITARPETVVASLAALMVRHRVHRVFIVQGAELVGVVTSMDVMQQVASTSTFVGTGSRPRALARR